MDEVTGEWRRLHNYKLYDLCSSPYIIWVLKSRRVRWAGNVARMGRGEVNTNVWWGNLGEIDDLEYLDVHRKTEFKWIFNIWLAGMVGFDVCQDRER